jgi:hypothetical protein
MVSSGMLHRVVLVRTDVSEEPGASFIRVLGIGELGTTQAATSNRRRLRRNTTRTTRHNIPEDTVLRCLGCAPVGPTSGQNAEAVSSVLVFACIKRLWLVRIMDASGQTSAGTAEI